MNDQWFIFSGDESLGPFTLEQVHDRFKQGELTSECFVRRLDGPWWTVAELFPPLSGSRPDTVVSERAKSEQPCGHEAASSNTPSNSEPSNPILEPPEPAPANDFESEAYGETRPEGLYSDFDDQPAEEPNEVSANESAAASRGTFPNAIAAATSESLTAHTTTASSFTRRRKRTQWIGIATTICSIVIGAVSAMYLANWILAYIRPQHDIEPSEERLTELRGPKRSPRWEDAKPESIASPVAASAKPSDSRVANEVDESPPTRPGGTVSTTLPTSTAISPIGSASAVIAPEVKPTSQFSTSPSASLPRAAPLPPPRSTASEVLRPIGSSPSSETAPMVPSPALPDPEGLAWIKEQESIDRKRDSLIQVIAEVQRETRPLIAQAQALDLECRGRERESSRLRQNMADISNEIERLASLSAVSIDPALSSRISSLESNARSIDRTLRTLNTTTERARYRKLMTEINVLEERTERLHREADALRAELIRHLNPFTEISDPVAEACLEYFNRTTPGDTIAKAWSEFGIACVHFRQGDDGTAEKFLASAMTLEPKDATFRAVRGYRRLQLGQDEAAHADLVAAMKVDASNWTVNYLMALYHFRKGMVSAAETFLRKCRELDKADYRAPALLSLLKSSSPDEKLRNAKFATQYAEEALRSAESPGSHLAMAAALAESREFARALDHARSAATLRAGALDGVYARCLEELKENRALRIDWKAFDPWNQL